MKNFGYTFLACLTAIFAAGMIMMVMTFLTFAGMMASLTFQKPVTPVAPGSVLMIDLENEISDDPSAGLLTGFDPYTMTLRRGVSTLQALSAIGRAAGDDNIKGIYLNIDPGTGMGFAGAEEIRRALDEFREESGKFIISYADRYSQMSYYLSSVADKVYMNPEGEVEWRGISSQVMFFKGALDKLGLKAEIFRSGDYKSAVEPFMYDKMSPESREQTSRLVNSIWGGIVSQVASSRGLDSAEVQLHASQLALRGAQEAVRHGFIDGAVYGDHAAAQLSELSGVDDPEIVSLYEYVRATEQMAVNRSENKVAVIYAEGDIVDGDGRDGEVGSRELASQLYDARMDESVKAVVLRINSPGGSVLASEVMWNEATLLREVKPLIVSMGDYAASGGYYIAAPADIILAGKYTVTGSIGVFGLMLDGEKALREKLGITVDVVRTNPSADMGTPFRALTPAEREYFQGSVESAYSTFIGHVSKGRNLTDETVRGIAGGRVWSGADSYTIGLVDGYGGLNDAIALAADRAGIAEDFAVESVSSHSDPFERMIRSLTSGSLFAARESAVDKLTKEYDRIVRMVRREGIQAAIPYGLVIND